jgi:hypothetical protein
MKPSTENTTKPAKMLVPQFTVGTNMESLKLVTTDQAYLAVTAVISRLVFSIKPNHSHMFTLKYITLNVTADTRLLTVSLFD